MKTPSKGQNSVRIIGGQWRRSVLHFPDSIGLRPTPDRVRETLFNWLGQELNGQRCLDLFAGSGALGFEAASRGAEKVVLVEQSPLVRQALIANQERLKANGSLEVHGGDALKIASKPQSPLFDVVFLDPPYHQGWLEKLAPLLGNLLRPEGALYVEAERPLAELGQWQTVKDGKAGQVFYHLMRQPSPAG